MVTVARPRCGCGGRQSRVIHKGSLCLAPPMKSANLEGQIIRRRSNGFGKPLTRETPTPRSLWERCTNKGSSFLKTTCWLASGIEKRQNILQIWEERDKVAIN